MAADHASENIEERTFLLKIFSTDIYDPYLIFYFCMNPDGCLYLHQRVCRGNYWAPCPKKNSRFSNFFALTQLVALFLLLRSLVQSLGVKARESFWTPSIKMPYLIHLLLAVVIPWIFPFIIRHCGNLVPPRLTSLFSWNKNKSCCLNLIKLRVLFGTGPPWNRDQV